ncbi:MAG: nucleotidyltransferase domain-containing protein [Chloroflexi bacterium]|nr:nucleotidyltransferase domain-containing protein [Chloroflexota bacterium]
MKSYFDVRTTAVQRQAALEFARQVREAKGDRILRTILIGSVARGDFGPDSDIDILVVAEGVDSDFKCDMWDIGADVSLARNVILNVHIYSRARWDKMQKEETVFWQNAQRDGIDIAPEPIPA